MLKLCVAVAVCLGAVSAVTGEAESATPKHCCMPLVYEGNMKFRFAQVVNSGALKYYDGNATMHFDFPNDRMAIIEQINVPGEWAQLSYITTANITYMIKPLSRSCTKFPVPPPKQKNPLNCIPDHAKYLGNESAGGMGGPTLDLDIWEYQAEFAGFIFNCRNHVIRDSCVPVLSVMNGTMKVGQLKQIQTLTYSEFKEGITNPKVFNVPEYCNEVQGSHPCGGALSP